MFEVFPSMKSQFAEISLPRLSQILTDPKPHPLAQHFDLTLQRYFELDFSKETESLKAIIEYQYQRKQFYSLLSKSLLKILKRELKKIEELIAAHSRNNDQLQFNRIKLDKILRECFGRVAESSECAHELVIDLEAKYSWNCDCCQPACEERQMAAQFIKDIFGFFSRSSQAINQEMKSAVQRKVTLHPLLNEADKLCDSDWAYGNKAGQLLLDIQNNCSKVNQPKKKKRNKKMKAKVEQEVVVQVNAEIDEQQKLLNSFLSSLQIKPNSRNPCVVTEEWLERIGHRSFTTFK